MNQNSNIRNIAVLVFIVIVFFVAYFIGNLAPVLNTNNDSFPEYKGFDEVDWQGSIEGVVSDIQITDASKGIGSITIENNNNFATFPVELNMNPGQGDTGVSRYVRTVDNDSISVFPVTADEGLNSIAVGDSVRLNLERLFDTTSDNYKNVSVSYISIAF